MSCLEENVFRSRSRSQGQSRRRFRNRSRSRSRDEFKRESPSQSREGGRRNDLSAEDEETLRSLHCKKCEVTLHDEDSMMAHIKVSPDQTLVSVNILMIVRASLT